MVASEGIVDIMDVVAPANSAELDPQRTFFEAP
jgi:hypothetical protein